MSTLDEFLATLELSQYGEALKANDIDLDVLKELSNDDLKDVGISSLGHRRKILAAVQDSEPTTPAATPAAAPAAAPSASGSTRVAEDKVFHETTFEHWKPLRRESAPEGVGGMFQRMVAAGSDYPWVSELVDVKITSHRAILGDTTFALANIAAVKLSDNGPDVARRNSDRQDAVDRSNKTLEASANSKKMVKTMLILIGIVVVLLGVGMDGTEETMAICGTAGVVMVLIGLFMPAAAEKPETFVPEIVRYSVAVVAGGPASDVLTDGGEKEAVEEIVNKLNEAITYLNV